MIIPLRIDGKEAEQFKKFAAFQNRTVTEMIKSAVQEKIQDEYDWKVYKEALADYEIDPKTFPLKKIKREWGIR